MFRFWSDTEDDLCSGSGRTDTEDDLSSGSGQIRRVI